MNGWYNEVKHLIMSNCDFLKHDIYNIGIVEQSHVLYDFTFYTFYNLAPNFSRKQKVKMCLMSTILRQILS